MSEKRPLWHESDFAVTSLLGTGLCAELNKRMAVDLLTENPNKLTMTQPWKASETVTWTMTTELTNIKSFPRTKSQKEN